VTIRKVRFWAETGWFNPPASPMIAHIQRNRLMLSFIRLTQLSLDTFIRSKSMSAASDLIK
jgi:hypothetical protein